MTSQKPELAQLATSDILLPSFGPLEGREELYTYLRSSTPTKDDQAAEALSEEVGGLPMAIAHLASHIDQSQCSIREFLVKFRLRNPTAEVWESASTTFTYQTSKTLDAIFDAGLQSVTSDAQKLVLILAFLDPDRVPEEIFDLLEQTPASEFLGRPGTFKFDGLIKNLRGWHLVHREQNILTIHRSLKRSLLHKLDKDPVKRQEIFELASALVVKRVPPQSEIEVAEEEKWPVHELYLSHVLSLHKIYHESLSMSPPITETLDFAELLSNVGRYLVDKGAHKDAMPLLELSESLYMKLDPELISSNHSKVLSTISLIYAWRGLSGRVKCNSYSARSLEIRMNRWNRTSDDQTTKTDRLLLSNAWEDHASNCLEQELFDQAEPFIQKSLALKRRCGAETDYPYEFAVSYCDLSIVCRAQGNKTACMDYLARGLALLELEPNANRTIIENLKLSHATRLFSFGDLGASLSATEDLYNTFIQRKANPRSLSYMSCEYLLATIHHRLGDFTNAERFLRAALEKRTSCEWSEEWIAKAKYLLSLVCAEQGKNEEANALRMDALECANRLLAGLHSPPARIDQDLLSSFDYMVNVHFRTMHHYPVFGAGASSV